MEKIIMNKLILTILSCVLISGCATWEQFKSDFKEGYNNPQHNSSSSERRYYREKHADGTETFTICTKYGCRSETYKPKW